MSKQLFIGLILLLVRYECLSSFTINQSVVSKDTMIKAGDYSLHFIITGDGEPTILLEAGGGADASQWQTIQQSLTAQTKATIISYDRAGFGSSELPIDSYDIKKEVKALHQCLISLGVNKLILTGHSYGAFLNQVYQFIYPETVLGIVLADPNNTIFVDSIGAKFLMRIPFDTTKPMTIQQIADVRQTVALHNTVETVGTMPFSAGIPITVISAGKDWWPFPQWNRMWKNSHQTLVNASSNRLLLKAESSAHNIPKEQPDIIIEAIIQMLNRDIKR